MVYAKRGFSIFTYHFLFCFNRIRHVRHIEKRELEASGVKTTSTSFLSFVPESKHMVLIQNMHICAVSGDLQITQHFELSRVSRIDNEKWIHLPEGHHIDALTGKTST